MMLPSSRYKGKFIPQLQPNGWSCLATSFAIALGIDVANFIEQIGHDGSEIKFPKYDEPYCRRGFHPQECFKIALRYGFVVSTYDSEVVYYSVDNIILPLLNDDAFINELLPGKVGILGGSFQGGSQHAVLWDGEVVLDPKGFIYSLDHFDVKTFYLIARGIF